MPRFIIFGATAILLILAGCDKTNVSGDVYIRKGDGTVAPAAGTTVHFISADSERALLDEIRAKTVAATLEPVASQLAAQCPAMVTATRDKLEKTKAELETVQQKGTIPTGGCDTLEAERSRMHQDVEERLAQQQAEVEQLEADLQAAREKRSEKIFALANELYKQAVAKVSVQLQTRGSIFDAVLTNNSEFCIGRTTKGLVVNIYSGEVLVRSREIDTTSDTQEDEYGFKKYGCYLDAEYERKLNAIAWQRDFDIHYMPSRHAGAASLLAKEKVNVALAKAIAEGKVKSTPCNSDRRSKNGECAELTHVTVNVEEMHFVTIDQREDETDGGRSYSSIPVVWIKKAEESYVEDGSIKAAEEKLVAAREVHEEENASSPISLAYEKATNAAKHCEADHRKVVSLESSIADIEAILVPIQNCPTSSPQTLSESLYTLNSRLSLGFDIPTMSAREFKTAFISEGIRTILSASAPSVDATIDGHYEITGLPKGKYLAVAGYNDNFVHGFWLEPVTIEEPFSQTVDLNMNSFVSVTLYSYLEGVLDACENCMTPEYVLPYSRYQILDAVEE